MSSIENSPHSITPVRVTSDRSSDLSVSSVSIGSPGAISVPLGGIGSVSVPGGVAAPPNARQLVILMPDGSGSMTLPLARFMLGGSSAESPATVSKAAAVAEATRGLVSDLDGSRAQNFEVGLVVWSDGVVHVEEPVALLDLDPGKDWNPCAYGGSGTRSAAALARARTMANQFFDHHAEEGLRRSVVVLMLTDGEDFGPADALREAEKLRETAGVTLATCHFADKGNASRGPELLEQMATPGYFQPVHDAEQLRSFFLRSTTQAGQENVLPAGSGR